MSETAITFDELIMGFLRDTGTEKALRGALRHLFPFFTERAMEDIQAIDLRRYIRVRRVEGAAASTLNKEIGVLSRAIHHANREWGLSLPNPVTGMKQREPEGRVRWLTRPQADALIAAARTLGPRAGHLPDLIVLALNTGMRKGELLGLEWTRVDFENGLLYLDARHTKSNKRRSVPINTLARAALVSRRAVSRSGWVFDGIQDVKRSFGVACQRCHLVNFRFHDLRHTFASWLVQSGVPLTEVRDLLGHSSIEMTERYAHLAPERLRGAVARLERA